MNPSVATCCACRGPAKQQHLLLLLLLLLRLLLLLLLACRLELASQRGVATLEVDASGRNHTAALFEIIIMVVTLILLLLFVTSMYFSIHQVGRAGGWGSL